LKGNSAVLMERAQKYFWSRAQGTLAMPLGDTIPISMEHFATSPRPLAALYNISKV